MRKLLPIAIVCLIAFQTAVHAQDKPPVKFGQVSAADFVLPASSVIDSNSNAVILADVGSVHFVGNDKGGFSYVYKRQTRIKFLNKKAFELATVKFRIYVPAEFPEKIDNLTATTYNLERGQVTETKLDKKDVFKEALHFDLVEYKFTMPAVKEGSVIEYSYSIISPYAFDLPGWTFQSVHAPCLWSEYSVNIPQTYLYVITHQGIHGFTLDKGSIGGESYIVSSDGERGGMVGSSNDLVVTANTMRHRWALKDVPAFHVESYIYTANNYLDEIDFQLSRAEKLKELSADWGKLTLDLLHRADFGIPLYEEGDWVKDLADKITAGISGPLEKARAIYYYVNSHFAWQGYRGIVLSTTLHDVVNKNGGSVADINLFLIALLRREGLEADPVLLSTRGFGFNYSSYPLLEKFDYLIARLNNNGQVVYLDGAHPQLGFGRLAGNCYNGHARIISLKDSASVYFQADSLKEQKTTTVFISATDKGLEGTYESLLGAQESYNTRLSVSQNGQEKYFRNIQTSWGEDLGISNTGIDSLKKTEDPVRVYYDIVLKQFPGSATFYFNPLLGEGIRENPFKAAERKYPVEMPYSMDNTYIFSMEVPSGYVVDEIPKSARVAFNGDQGLFEYLIDAQGDHIRLRCRLKLNKAYFTPDDYANLRDFFAFVVKKENETVVLKKK